MRVSGIHINNFLSFDSFEWRELDTHLNIIVGPNASGKTNLFHAFRAVRAVVNYDLRQEASSWASLPHLPNREELIEIGLDLELTDAWERGILAGLLCATLTDERAIQSEFIQLSRNLDRNRLSGFSLLVRQQLHDEPPTWLFSGRLVVQHDGKDWRSFFASYTTKPDFYVGLDSPRGYSVLLGQAELPDPAVGSVFAAWRRSLSEEERTRLDAFLSDPNANVECPIPNLNDLPKYVPSRYSVPFEVEPPAMGPSPAYEAFRQLDHATYESGQRPSVRSVFQQLLTQGIFFTDNVRSVPKSQFASDALVRPVGDLSRGDNLALYLFHLKNGPEPAKRSQYAAIEAIFGDITGSRFDVSLDAAPQQYTPFRTSPSDQDKAQVVIEITVDAGRGHIPLQYSGAGITEILYLCTLLGTSGDRIVLLDEPASNLHPPVQSSVLTAIRRSTSNQFVIVSHSPAMLGPQDIAHVSRFTARRGTTARSALDVASAGDRLAKLEKILRESYNARGFLFHRAVILAEGASELAALPHWFERLYGYTMGSKDILLFTVDGDQQFSTLVWYLRQFAIPWVVVCDAKVYNPQPPGKNIRDQLETAGILHLPDIGSLGFAQRKAMLEPFGVFTMAESPMHELENVEGLATETKGARKVVGRSKARKAAYVAEHVEPPAEADCLFEKIKDYVFETYGVAL